MSFLQFIRQLKWKYIIGEIILLFIGINLAIWFNDWNASRKTDRDKQFAIEKLKEEIENNKEELLTTNRSNQQVVRAYEMFQQSYRDNTDRVIMRPEQLHHFQAKYPGFYIVADSVPATNGQFAYDGQTFIRLELSDLRAIAWQTVQSTRVSNELNYPCLYELESIYNLQRRIQHETDKAAEALQQRQIAELMRILEFIDQLVPPLLEDYQKMLTTLDTC